MTYTPLQEKMLTVIRDNGDWMTVKQIAEAIGREGGKPLPTDYSHLKIIAQTGDIEQDVRIKGAVKPIYFYKAKGQK